MATIDDADPADEESERVPQGNPITPEVIAEMERMSEEYWRMKCEVKGWRVWVDFSLFGYHFLYIRRRKGR